MPPVPRVGRCRGSPSTALVPDVILAGPGDGGLFRSTDGGVNWQMTNDQIAFNPVIAFGADGQTAYASSSYMPVSIWRSDDNGASWEPIPISGTYREHYVIPHPTLADTVFAITSENDDPSYDGLYRSDNRGEEWLKITNGISGTELTGNGDRCHSPTDHGVGPPQAGRSISPSTVVRVGAMLPRRCPFRSAGWASTPPAAASYGPVAYQGDCSVAKSLTPDLTAWTEVQDYGGRYAMVILPSRHWRGAKLTLKPSLPQLEYTCKQRRWADLDDGEHGMDLGARNGLAVPPIRKLSMLAV